MSCRRHSAGRRPSLLPSLKMSIRYLTMPAPLRLSIWERDGWLVDLTAQPTFQSGSDSGEDSAWRSERITASSVQSATEPSRLKWKRKRKNGRNAARRRSDRMRRNGRTSTDDWRSDANARAGCAYFGRKTLGFCSTHYRAQRFPALQGVLCEIRPIVSRARLRAVWIECVCRLLIVACRGIGSGGRRRPLLIAVAAGVGDAEVVFGVLIEIFDGDTVIADRSFPCERDVPLENLMGATADFDVGTIAVEGLASLWRSLLLRKWPVAVVAPAGRALG